MTQDIYLEFLEKVKILENRYKSDQLEYLTIESTKQFAEILTSLETDKNMCDHYGKYLLKYVNSFLIAGSENLNKSYVEDIKAKYYYPVLHYLEKKHKYYTGGWIGIMIIIGLPLDLFIYWLAPFGDYFIPFFTVGYFIKKQVEYFYKKRIGKVLIENR